MSWQPEQPAAVASDTSLVCVREERLTAASAQETNSDNQNKQLSKRLLTVLKPVHGGNTLSSILHGHLRY